MEITAKKIDSANAQIQAKIDKDTIQKHIDKMAKEAAKTLDLPGFRKGKVPVKIVKQRYADKLKEDAKNEAVKEVYEKGIKELTIEKTSLLGEPIVEKFVEDENGMIEISIALATKPEVNIDGYKDLVPEFEVPQVSDDEVQERINNMLKSIIEPSKVEDRDELQKGDFVLIDFEGFIDDKPFEGGKAEAYLLEVGSGSFIPGFEDGMIGMKVDEQKDIKVTFPKDYGSKELAGKDAVFKVKLLEIQEKKIPADIDGETLKKLLPNDKEPTVEKLKDRVKKQILAEKLAPLYANEIKPKYVEILIEKYDIDLPKSIVEQEMDIAFRKILSDMHEDEIRKFSEDVEEYKKKREEFRKEAEDSVKITFLVNEMASKEGIVVDDNEVLQTLYFEALQMGQNPQEMIKQYEEQGLLPAVKMAIIEERLFNKLFNDKKGIDLKA